MSDDTGKVDEILDELDLNGDITETPSESVEDEEALPDEDPETSGRLSKLHEAGVITDEEYQVLQSHRDEDDVSDPEEDTSSNSIEFGKPIVTSEGPEMDHSIVGIIDDVDTTSLNYDSIKEGGPGRTLIFWQIHNHSGSETLHKHKHIEHIGDDRIAYARDSNPLRSDFFKPGWRMENWEQISADTRIRYVSSIHMPSQIETVKVDGKSSHVHEFDVTEEMRFAKSELPITVDL